MAAACPIPTTDPIQMKSNNHEPKYDGNPLTTFGNISMTALLPLPAGEVVPIIPILSKLLLIPVTPNIDC